MVLTMKRLLLVALILPILILGCKDKGPDLNPQGTETGNPGSTGSETGNPASPSAPAAGKSYSNNIYGVSAQYDPSWNPTEIGAVVFDSAGNSPSVAPMTGIDTANAPSTLFTDGRTTVTLYYVTLGSRPISLETYLVSVFPDRVFISFSNASLSGFKYDNPEPGLTGGDRQEYYFLKGTTLLYIVTDLFAINDGVKNFNLLIDSLAF